MIRSTPARPLQGSPEHIANNRPTRRTRATRRRPARLQDRIGPLPAGARRRVSGPAHLPAPLRLCFLPAGARSGIPDTRSDRSPRRATRLRPPRHPRARQALLRLLPALNRRARLQSRRVSLPAPSLRSSAHEPLSESSEFEGLERLALRRTCANTASAASRKTDIKCRACSSSKTAESYEASATRPSPTSPTTSNSSVLPDGLSSSRRVWGSIGALQIRCCPCRHGLS